MRGLGACGNRTLWFDCVTLSFAPVLRGPDRLDAAAPCSNIVFVSILTCVKPWFRPSGHVLLAYSSGVFADTSECQRDTIGPTKDPKCSGALTMRLVKSCSHSQRTVKWYDTQVLMLQATKSTFVKFTGRCCTSTAVQKRCIVYNRSSTGSGWASSARRLSMGTYCTRENQSA